MEIVLLLLESLALVSRTYLFLLSKSQVLCPSPLCFGKAPFNFSELPLLMEVCRLVLTSYKINNILLKYGRNVM